MEEILKQATAKLEKLQAQYFELLMDGKWNEAETTKQDMFNYLNVCKDTFIEMNNFKQATQDSK